MTPNGLTATVLTKLSTGGHPVTESIEDAFSLCNYVLGVLLNQYRAEGDVTEKTGFEVLDACRVGQTISLHCSWLTLELGLDQCADFYLSSRPFRVTQRAKHG